MTPPDDHAGPDEGARVPLVPFFTAIVIAGSILNAYLAIRRGFGWEIPTVSVAALAACLWALASERRARVGLVALTKTRTRQISRLSETLKVREERANVLERRVDDLTKLYRAISTVNSVQDPSYAFDSVVRAALELVGGDRGSLMLVDRSAGAFVIRSQHGLGREVPARSRVPLGEGVAGWVAQQKLPLLLVGPASADGRFDHPQDRPVQSALCVPLQCHGDVIGVLNLACSNESGKSTFAEDDKNMSHIFAQHAAVTVRYAQLWERSTG